MKRIEWTSTDLEMEPMAGKTVVGDGRCFAVNVAGGGLILIPSDVAAEELPSYWERSYPQIREWALSDEIALYDANYLLLHY